MYAHASVYGTVYSAQSATCPTGVHHAILYYTILYYTRLDYTTIGIQTMALRRRAYRTPRASYRVTSHFINITTLITITTTIIIIISSSSITIAIMIYVLLGVLPLYHIRCQHGATRRSTSCVIAYYLITCVYIYIYIYSYHFIIVCHSM